MSNLVRVHTFQTVEVIDILLNGEDYVAKLGKSFFHGVRSRYKWVKDIINKETNLSISEENNIVYGFCNIMDNYEQLRHFSFALPEICQYFKLHPSERKMIELLVPEEYIVYTDYGLEIYKEPNFIVKKEEIEKDGKCQVMLPFIKSEWVVDIIDIEDETVGVRHFKGLSQDFKDNWSKSQYIWQFRPRKKNGVMKDDIDLIYSNGFPEDWKELIIQEWYS